MTARPFPLIATLCTAAAFLILCTLGSWQLLRLQEKQALLAALANAAAPQELPLAKIEDIERIAADGAGIGRVRVQGIYSGDHITVGPRSYKSQPGFHLYAPLYLEEGAVLVNRGWVSIADVEAAPLPQGPVEVTGLLRRPDKPNPFTPPNDPAAGQWFFIDLPQIALVMQTGGLAPAVLYAENESGDPALPVRDALRWNPPNNHLGYALFWYSMALTLAVIYYFRFLRPWTGT
jgi:surfeit locus 1 family protein